MAGWLTFMKIDDSTGPVLVLDDLSTEVLDGCDARLADGAASGAWQLAGAR